MFLPLIKVSIDLIESLSSKLLLVNLKLAGIRSWLYHYVAYKNARAMVFGGQRNRVSLCLRI